VTVTAPLPAATAPAVPHPQVAGSSGANAGSSGTHPIRRRDPLLASEDYKADDEETLPSINEINLSGSQSLPELHLDVHVFATRSTERFVFINMRKYHEGATLQEGPTIERIRRDGVILNYQGLRFLLPRQ
jgi:general secretion pathway protein B